MDFWVRSERMEAWVKKERDYLLGINDYDALKLSTSEQYQRNKYKGEIEAAKMLDEIRRKQVFEKPIAKKYTKSHKNEPTNVFKFKDGKNDE